MLSEDIKLTKLDSGLRVVTKKVESFESIAMGYWVEAGGIFEDDSNCGISHFLEHMAFKGTKSRTVKQIAYEIESVGGNMNAYTAKEVTAYHVKLLKNDRKIAIDILSDILQNPVFVKEELERERGVILQEICQTYDAPDDIIFDYFQKVAFADQQMGAPVLGYKEIVSKISSDDLRAYSSKYYNADNIVFSAVGNVSHEQILEEAAEYFSKFPKKSTQKDNVDYEYVGGSFSDIRDFEQVHAIVGFRGVPSAGKDYYTMAILSSILGGGMSSRLFQEIREKRGLVYNIYSFFSSFKNDGIFGIYSATTCDKLPELAEVLIVELLKIKDDIFEEEFQRTRAQFKANLLMSAENSIVSCERIVNQVLIFGKPIYQFELLEKLNSVTIEDVKALAKKMLQTKASVITVGKCDGSSIEKSIRKNELTI